MDLHSLKAIIRSAESVTCEHGDASGMTVGQVWEDWPEEILSGRLAASSRTRTTTNKLVKAYTKFAQAAAELHQLAGQTTAPVAPVVLKIPKNSLVPRGALAASMSNKYPLVATTVTAAEDQLPMIPSLKPAKPKLKCSRDAGSQTETWADAFPQIQRLRGSSRWRHLLYAIMALALPKIFLVFFRVLVEHILGFFLAGVYGMLFNVAEESQVLAGNLLGQFEKWLMYGASARKAPSPMMVPPLPLPKVVAKSIAAAANISLQAAEEICEAAEFQQPNLVPMVTESATTVPGILSVGIIAILAKAWQKF
jgi:hypothetical protein